MSDTLKVIRVIEGTAVDGPGLRTSVYFAGCRHCCPGCHNPQSWSFDAGESMSVDSLLDIIDYNGFNVTFTGGDPMYVAEKLLPLAEAVTSSGKNIWCYTGFSFEELTNMRASRRLLNYIDVLVDGPFILDKRDTSLRFRGSSNQRLINVPLSLKHGQVVLWDEE